MLLRPQQRRSKNSNAHSFSLHRDTGLGGQRDRSAGYTTGLAKVDGHIVLLAGKCKEAQEGAEGGGGGLGGGGAKNFPAFCSPQWEIQPMACNLSLWWLEFGPTERASEGVLEWERNAMQAPEPSKWTHTGASWQLHD